MHFSTLSTLEPKTQHSDVSSVYSLLLEVPLSGNLSGRKISASIPFRMKPLETLYIVMPCYNEEAGLTTTITTVSNELQKLISAGRIAADSAMLFCDDGSKDETWSIIEQQHQSNPMVKGARLAA